MSTNPGSTGRPQRCRAGEARRLRTDQLDRERRRRTEADHDRSFWLADCPAAGSGGLSAVHRCLLSTFGDDDRGCGESAHPVDSPAGVTGSWKLHASVGATLADCRVRMIAIEQRALRSAVRATGPSRAWCSRLCERAPMTSSAAASDSASERRTRRAGDESTTDIHIRERSPIRPARRVDRGELAQVVDGSIAPAASAGATRPCRVGVDHGETDTSTRRRLEGVGDGLRRTSRIVDPRTTRPAEGPGLRSSSSSTMATGPRARRAIRDALDWNRSRLERPRQRRSRRHRGPPPG